MVFEDTADDDQGQTASVRIGPLDDGVGFYVEDGEWSAPAEVRDAMFGADDSWDVASGGPGAFGGALWDAGEGGPTGSIPRDIGFTVLREVANADGWEVTVTDGPTGDVRVEVRDVLPESN